ncbi:MAG: ParA family protein [Desulfobacterales bacterium]|nr:ParA family protein [Desulfobacterales bacterium]
MKKRAKIITITSRKGGVGKTAVTSLLARYFTEVEGKKVLVVDFDARGGISSLLSGRPIKTDDLSIVELLMVADQEQNVQDAFEQAIVETGLEKSKNWKDNGGKLYLLPAKPALDTVIPDKDPHLLKDLLHDLDLSDEYVVLIDTGPESSCVTMGVSAADVVFIPLILSRQDVHPTIETLRTIFQNQNKYGNAVLGGMVVNQSQGTKWERHYIDKYIEIFDRFQHTSKMMGATDSLFIELDQSRIIRKGTFLDWPFRENFIKTGQAMADAVHAVDIV